MKKSISIQQIMSDLVGQQLADDSMVQLLIRCGKAIPQDLKIADKLLQQLITPAHWKETDLLLKTIVMLHIPWLVEAWLSQRTTEGQSKADFWLDQLRDTRQSETLIRQLPAYGQAACYLLSALVRWDDLLSKETADTDSLCSPVALTPRRRHNAYLKIAEAYRQTQGIPDTQRRPSLPTPLEPLMLSDHQIDQRCHDLFDSYCLEQWPQSTPPLPTLMNRELHLQDQINRYLRLLPRLETQHATGEEKSLACWRQRAVVYFSEHIEKAFKNATPCLEDFERIFKTVIPLAEQWLAQQQRQAVQELCQLISEQTKKDKARGFSAKKRWGKTSLGNLTARSFEEKPIVFLTPCPDYPQSNIRDRLQTARKLLEESTSLLSWVKLSPIHRNHPPEKEEKYELPLPSALSSSSSSSSSSSTMTSSCFPKLSDKSALSIWAAQAVYTQTVREVLQDLIQEVATIIYRICPPPCAFSILGIGSISRGSMCPGSDLDIAILLADEKHRTHRFFPRLIEILQMRLAILGLPGLEIDEVDIQNLIDEYPKFLNTPENLADFIESAKRDEDKISVYALLRPAELYASADQAEKKSEERLWGRYQKAREKILKKVLSQEDQEIKREEKVTEEKQPALDNETVITSTHFQREQVLAIEYLTRHGREWEKYKTNEAKSQSAQTVVNLKKSYLQPLIFWCMDLALYFGLQDSQGQPLTELSAILDGLRSHLFTPFVDDIRYAIDWIHQQLIVHQSRFYQELWRHQLPDVYSLYRDEKAMPEELKKLSITLSQQRQLDAIEAWVLQTAYMLTSGWTMQTAEPDFKTDPWQRKWRDEKPESLKAQLSNLAYTTCVRQKSFVDHRQIYQRIPDDWKFEYLNRMEPEAFKLLPKQEATVLLNSLGDIPLPNGRRWNHGHQIQAWEELLMQITEPWPKDGEQKNVVKIEWFNSRNERCIRGLRSADADKLFDEKGRLRLSEEEKKKGKRKVISLCQDTDQEKSPIQAYAKVYPEMPGVQAIVDNLSWHISGYGCITTLCQFTHPQQTQAYPVLLSKNVGQPLADIATRKDQESPWPVLDRYAFTLKIIECLLINPEDYKFDNLAYFIWRLASGEERYRLIGFDSDHAFMEPLLSSAWGSVKVNVKNGLYCLNAMQEPLDSRAIADFLSLDINACLEDWLKALVPVNQHFRQEKNQTPPGLFTTEDMQYGYKKQNSFIPLAFISGTVKTVYEKLLRVRAALQDMEAPVNTPMDLLARMEPLLARYYQQTFAPEHLDPESRFKTLPTNYTEIKDPETQKISRQSIYQVRQSAPQSIAVTRESRAVDLHKAIRDNLLCTPQHVLKHEWPYIQKYHHKISELRTELQQLGELKRWLRTDLSPYEREQVIQRVDFKVIYPKKQTQILDSLLKFSPYQALHLSHVQALTDDILIQIVKYMPELHLLDISHCTSITANGVHNILYYCRNLQTLRLAGLTQLTRLDASLFKRSYTFFPNELSGAHLQLLDLSGCLSLQEISSLYLPRLLTLMINHCPELTMLMIQAWRLKSFRSEQCPQLKTCEYYGVGVFEDEKEFLRWLAENGRKGDADARDTLKIIQSRNPYALMPTKPGAKPVEKLLALVAEGEQDLAEEIIKRNPVLLRMTGEVKDLSGRIFLCITAFQYALWALDWHMWTMIQKYLPEAQQREQFAALELKGTEHGTHFSLQPLIDALQIYVDKAGKEWGYSQLADNHWQTVVGGAQRLLPVHVIHEYCRPDRSFDPCPSFTENTLPRTRSDDLGFDCLTVYYNGGLLGEKFAVTRDEVARAGRVCAVLGGGGRGRCVSCGECLVRHTDLLAIQTLCKTRVQQLDKLSVELQISSPGAGLR